MLKVVLFASLFSLIFCATYYSTEAYSYRPTSDITTASSPMIRFFLDLNKNAYCYYGNISPSGCLNCSFPSGLSSYYRGRETTKSTSYNYFIFKPYFVKIFY